MRISLSLKSGKYMTIKHRNFFKEEKKFLSVRRGGPRNGGEVD
jgi:hypothetical protein